MKKLTTFFVFISFVIQLEASAPIYNKDGLQLSQTLTKVSTVFNHVLNRNVVIWKSIFEIKNTSTEAFSLEKPVYLKFNRSYLTQTELTTIRDNGYGYNIAANYRNIATNAKTIISPNQVISSEKYFVTFDDVDLSKEQYSWDLQYIK